MDFIFNIHGIVAYADGSTGPFGASYYRGNTIDLDSAENLENFKQLYVGKTAEIEALFALLPGTHTFTGVSVVAPKAIVDYDITIYGRIARSDGTWDDFALQRVNGIVNDIASGQAYEDALSDSTFSAAINNVYGVLTGLDDVASLVAVNPYQSLADIFGADLVGQYDETSLYQDVGKTVLADSPGDTIAVWADLTDHIDLDNTIESFFGNGMPGPLVNESQLNGYPVFGSGWIYDATTGVQVTQSGDPGVNGVFNGFFDNGFDAEEDTYTLFSVSRDLIADNLLLTLTDINSTNYRSIYCQDHHLATGSVLQNLVDSENQSYKGPDGDNFWHTDGEWRVIAITLSWTRLRNALWVNGTKYAAGTGLPVQDAVDTGAGADLLVPTDPDAYLEINDSIPQAFVGIVRGVQSDADILEAVRHLGFKYGIDVE